MLFTRRTSPSSRWAHIRALAILVGIFGLLGGAAVGSATSTTTDQVETESTDECTDAVVPDTSVTQSFAGRVETARLVADTPRSCPKPTVGLKPEGNGFTVVTGDATQRDGIQVKPGTPFKSDATGKPDANGTSISFVVEFPNYQKDLWDCRATGVYVPGGEGLGTPRVEVAVRPPQIIVGGGTPPEVWAFQVTVPAATVGRQSVQIQLTCTPKP